MSPNGGHGRLPTVLVGRKIDLKALAAHGREVESGETARGSDGEVGSWRRVRGEKKGQLTRSLSPSSLVQLIEIDRKEPRDPPSSTSLLMLMTLLNTPGSIGGGVGPLSRSFPDPPVRSLEGMPWIFRAGTDEREMGSRLRERRDSRSYMEKRRRRGEQGGWDGSEAQRKEKERANLNRELKPWTL